MYTEHECGICYRTYNAGRRCPRELHCKHSFCESCLLALSRPLGPDEARLGADRFIVCPLCRHTTSISGEGKMRAELRVDEFVLERLLASGVLYQEEEDDDPEEDESRVQDGCDDTEEPTLPETPAEDNDFSTGSRGGRLRRSWRKVWRLISGKSSLRRGGEKRDRCPRELHCKHSFCESCLLALSRPLGPDEARLGADRFIVCPLCRHTTSISGEGKMRAELRVDEFVLERLLASGVLYQEEEDDDPEEDESRVQDGCDDTEEPTLPETPTEDNDFSTGSRSGRLRRSWRKVWRLISGKSSLRRGGENSLTNDDMRNLAMMSCYMF